MITKINHIGIAVNSIDSILKLYTDVLGLKLKELETMEGQKAKAALITVGESRIELLESTDPQGPIGKFIEKRGEGLHHLALETNDIQGTLKMLEAKGIQLIDKTPRRGVSGAKIAFVHPKDTKVLLELVESASK